ncbi:MAG: hypothetical protein ACR2OZ_05735 [Verrucomicrobiales bacterium]
MTNSIGPFTNGRRWLIDAHRATPATGLALTIRNGTASTSTIRAGTAITVTAGTDFPTAMEDEDSPNEVVIDGVRMYHRSNG